MSMKPNYRMGQRFGLLTVIATAATRQRPGSKYQISQCVVKCDCGNEKIVRASALTTLNTTSCGCVGLAKVRLLNHKHGMSGTVEYKTWVRMIKRCANPNVTRWEDWGGRGIKVCERWRVSFENFYADMGDRPIGLTLERINNDGDYEPGNCKWATNTEQARNRRSVINVTIDGETHCVSEWCEKLGISPKTVLQRIRSGWKPVEALRAKAKEFAP